MIKKNLAAIAAGVILAGIALTGCTADNTEYLDREAQQDSVTLKDSLEIHNLTEKLQRQNDPNAIRYVYLMNFGQIVGFYVIQGKVSSNGSQLAPETDLVDPPGNGYEYYQTDSSQDDGTYGTGDPGIFFFTTEGVLVETSLDYIASDSPIAIDVPRLNG